MAQFVGPLGRRRWRRHELCPLLHGHVDLETRMPHALHDGTFVSTVRNVARDPRSFATIAAALALVLYYQRRVSGCVIATYFGN